MSTSSSEEKVAVETSGIGSTSASSLEPSVPVDEQGQSGMKLGSVGTKVLLECSVWSRGQGVGVCQAAEVPVPH